MTDGVQPAGQPSSQAQQQPTLRGARHGPAASGRVQPNGQPSPVACPDCGSENVARYLYGEPAGSARFDGEMAAGRTLLGGCVIGDEQPDFRCNACGRQFADRRNAGTPDAIVAHLLPAGAHNQAFAVGRLVLTGRAASAKEGRRTIAVRRSLLVLALEALARQEVSARYLLTSAGFLKAKVPDGCRMTHGWDTDPGDFASLRPVAEHAVDTLLDEATHRLAVDRVAYLVAGVDIYADGKHGAPHAELAVVYDVQAGRTIAVTGKSYPTSEQERSLIRNRDVRSHLREIDGDRVAILVCHDLVAWGVRSERNRRGPRARAGEDLVAAVEGPTLALHLPHTVSTSRTWANPWKVFRDQHPDLQGWASAILYRTKMDRRPTEPLGSALLRATAGGDDDTVAIIVGES